MTRAIFGRSSSSLASSSIIEAITGSRTGSDRALAAPSIEALLVGDALHQRHHPLDHLGLVVGVRHLVGVGEQQPFERGDAGGRSVDPTAGSLAAARNPSTVSRGCSSASRCAICCDREALGERDAVVRLAGRRAQAAEHVADVVAGAQLVVPGHDLEPALPVDVPREHRRVLDEPVALRAAPPTSRACRPRPR